ncbi:hypothetical protein TrVE_jg4982 [Triparma verrucosa]|uniref:Uncharacterized protein n=1 Tax=Triparma verrucosa TaxID=1606542 RepID=A0A9W7F913_9STRA|nr:hypothetical protein TrVE_jg4982 [Triparma verrucosa]
MNYVYVTLLLCLFIHSGYSFAPSTFGLARQSTLLPAKHAMKKAAKGHNAYRPKKSRPSDKNRKKVVYELDTFVKPEEFTVKGS